METPETDPVELEVQLIIRNKKTGTAEERIYFRTQGVTIYQDNADDLMDVVVSFGVLKDAEHDENFMMIKDLGIAPPCTCYEKLTGK